MTCDCKKAVYTSLSSSILIKYQNNKHDMLVSASIDDK